MTWRTYEPPKQFGWYIPGFGFVELTKPMTKRDAVASLLNDGSIPLKKLIQLGTLLRYMDGKGCLYAYDQATRQPTQDNWE